MRYNVYGRRMAIKINRFEWDEHNLGHLEHAHPSLDQETLPEIVRNAKRYVRLGRDRYGKMVYGARRGRLLVLFNIKRGRVVRIFSVRRL